MLTVIRGRSDSIALTKSLLIAAWAVLSCRACPLSRFAPAPPEGEPLPKRRSLTEYPKPLPLGELSPKVTERARMLTVIRGRSDSIALTKSLIIAAWAVLSRRACPLSLAFARQLPQRGSHWQAGPLPTGRLRPDMAQKGGPCLRGQRLLDKRTLSSCRWPRQRSTTVSEKIRLCSSRVGLTGTPEAPPLGEVSPQVTERARMLTVIRRRSDSIALTKSLLIAAWGSFHAGLALSVSLSLASSPKGGALRPTPTLFLPPLCYPRKRGWSLCGRSSISMCCFW